MRREADESLNRLLRAWRSRVVRRDVRGLQPGLAGRNGRRSAATGLSQAEVARLAGASEGWYRSLERGTRQDFSDAFLLRVAEVLQLSRAETLTLFHGVAGRRPPADPDEPRAEIASDLQELLEHQSPYPAYISDGTWNIVAVNSAMTEWFPWSEKSDANLMRWALLAPEAREQLLDWEDNFARVYLAMLRLAHSRQPGNPALQALTDEILAGDAVCRRLWETETTVEEHRSGHRFRLRLPCHGNREIGVTSHVLRPIQCPESRLVVLTGADTAHHGRARAAVREGRHGAERGPGARLGRAHPAR
ncbi:helix-turn-helix transcriptional regulator [Streptomyces sp. I05A-00742]|uniref:helix-turn-helix transcriptional regulator n=1 Tax=Streptomyces sp. I05A-00742 TaxID=2732853 RepID=UPI0014892C76|nr:helix-turn-helix transcriptional regulator [Streptomyces sp. I05A-00742]